MIDASSIKYAMCTLFDSNYLDKGLVLYDSLEKYASSFTLYVLAMDSKCYEVLTDMNLKHLVPIKLSDFENDELLRVKPTRGIGEYCWTCGSSLIKYIFDTYNPDYCSYIDADMAFYDDPIVLVEELEDRKASVSICPHRFYWCVRKEMEHTMGKYCVECNTFKNDKKARMLLEKWIGQCLERCSLDGDGVHWGDQKYMHNWVSDYDFVIETDNAGAGVASWNICQYSFAKQSTNNKIIVRYHNHIYNLLFYHFENLFYVDDNTIYISAYSTWKYDDKLIKQLNISYINSITEKKLFLKDKYGIDNHIKKHPGVTEKTKGSKISRALGHFSSWNRIVKFFFLVIPIYFHRNKNIIKIPH